MNPNQFLKELNEAQDLMSQEKYREALDILEKLKLIEKNGEFDYTLTHKLYQLISNSKSLLNQQIILGIIKEISQTIEGISFAELNKILRERMNLILEEAIVRREVEILILRDLLKCKMDGEMLYF